MRPTLIIAAAASVAALLVTVGPALAQANRTFVSGNGVDTNPCSLAAPCRSFTGAIAQTNAGGEIVALDSAGYGTVTITKSISINAPAGIEGGVTTASAVDGITVTVGASDVVNLRGLTLVGGGVGNNGISFTNLGALNIQNCVIRGFAANGIAFTPVGAAALNVADTIVSNVAQDGVEIQPTGAGTVTGAFNRVQAIASALGFIVNGSNATGAVNATIANSMASNNQFGVVTEGTSTPGAAVTQVMMVNSVVANNGTGIFGNGLNSTTYLARNTIAGNGLAFNIINSGALFSFGDNDVKSNVNDGGAITLVATK